MHTRLTLWVLIVLVRFSELSELQSWYSDRQFWHAIVSIIKTSEFYYTTNNDDHVNFAIHFVFGMLLASFLYIHWTKNKAILPNFHCILCCASCERFFNYLLRNLDLAIWNLIPDLGYFEEKNLMKWKWLLADSVSSYPCWTFFGTHTGVVVGVKQ